MSTTYYFLQVKLDGVQAIFKRGREFFIEMKDGRYGSVPIPYLEHKPFMAFPKDWVPLTIQLLAEGKAAPTLTKLECLEIASSVSIRCTNRSWNRTHQAISRPLSRKAIESDDMLLTDEEARLVRIENNLNFKVFKKEAYA